jgi:hypothetical protein
MEHNLGHTPFPFWTAMLNLIDYLYALVEEASFNENKPPNPYSNVSYVCW